MTILDSFFILFESDAAKLDKGLTDSEKKAKDLVGKLGTVDAAAGKMGATLLHSLAGLAGAAVATAGLVSMSQAIAQAADHADKLNESTERLGLNIETVSAWGDLVKKNGGSAEGFIGSIEGLNSQLAQMEATGKSRAAPFLKQLGIDLDLAANKGKTAMDFLPQIADAFKGMDKQKSVALGKRLGFDQGTIMTLQQGRREVEALLEKEKELGVVTKKQGEIADAFGDQMDDTGHAFRSVWLGVMEYVLPPLTWMMKKFQDVAVFMREHSHFVIGIMAAIGAAILTFALPPLISMAAAVIVAFAPFILAGALVAALATAFALLYEDIMTFVEGGDSMVGAILNRWPAIGEVVKGIIGHFKKLWGVAESVGDFLAQLWDSPQKAFTDFLNFLLGGLKAIINAIPGLSAVLGALGFDTSEPAKPGEKPKEDTAATKAAIAAGQGAISQANSTPMASQTSSSITNTTKGGKNTSVQVGKVEVHTQATDAAGISKAIGGTMQTQMRQAVNNFDDGVLA